MVDMTEKTELRAEDGRSVTIKYTITLEDGSKIEEREGKPFTFRMGAKKVIPALEKGMGGMQVDEVRRINVTPEQGYGLYNKDLVLKVEKKMLPDDIRLAPGRPIQYQNRDGERANFVIRKIEKDHVTIDGNHPLAGQNLIYEVELLDVR